MLTTLPAKLSAMFCARLPADDIVSLNIALSVEPIGRKCHASVFNLGYIHVYMLTLPLVDGQLHSTYTCYEAE